MPKAGEFIPNGVRFGTLDARLTNTLNRPYMPSMRRGGVGGGDGGGADGDNGGWCGRGGGGAGGGGDGGGGAGIGGATGGAIGKGGGAGGAGGATPNCIEVTPSMQSHPSSSAVSQHLEAELAQATALP